MHMFDAESVHRLLPYQELIPALMEMHEGEMPDGDGIYTDDPRGNGQHVRHIARLAWRPTNRRQDGWCLSLRNRDRDPPIGSVLGAVAAFDAETGAPIFVADGEAMTYRKTAAISGLGTALLAPPNPRITFSVVGAGGLGPHVAMAHIAARPSISSLRIWNRTAPRAEALAADLRELKASEPKRSQDLDAAVAEADVISCVTMSRKPLVKGALSETWSTC